MPIVSPEHQRRTSALTATEPPSGGFVFSAEHHHLQGLCGVVDGHKLSTTEAQAQDIYTAFEEVRAARYRLNLSVLDEMMAAAREAKWALVESPLMSSTDRAVFWSTHVGITDAFNQAVVSKKHRSWDVFDNNQHVSISLLSNEEFDQISKYIKNYSEAASNFGLDTHNKISLHFAASLDNIAIVGELDRNRSPTLRQEFERPSEQREPPHIGGLSILDASAAVAELVREHILPFTPEDVNTLTKAILDAQTNRPQNVKQFIENVNTLLDTYSVRLSVDGQLCRLAFRPGRVDGGYIVLSGGRIRNRGGFETVEFELVPVRQNFIGNNLPVNSPK